MIIAFQSTPKLYNVTTVVKEYHDCKDVPFHWFRCDPGPQKLPYAELIQNYNGDNFYAENYIGELFTADEAALVKDYLDRDDNSHKNPTTINEVSLPIPNNVMGVGAIAVGGGDDFYMLDKNPDYSLPFKVWGYFNLVDCELADGSGVYPLRLWRTRPARPNWSDGDLI